MGCGASAQKNDPGEPSRVVGTTSAAGDSNIGADGEFDIDVKAAIEGDTGVRSVVVSCLHTHSRPAAMSRESHVILLGGTWRMGVALSDTPLVCPTPCIQEVLRGCLPFETSASTRPPFRTKKSGKDRRRSDFDAGQRRLGDFYEVGKVLGK